MLTNTSEYTLITQPIKDLTMQYYIRVCWISVFFITAFEKQTI
uniref:Uncharacterized protein n=1 Tax=Anguilla anguilla TaxID=7936 RepID=A0A0E9QUD3_ANGAN